MGNCNTVLTGTGKTLLVRLNAEERAMLARLCGASVKRNPSELVRFLIRREHGRLTTRSSIVADADFSTDWRIGRPKRRKTA